jgi:RNA-dependent RNA polymerase
LGDWEGKENWYGGKIQQVARLVEVAERSTSSSKTPQKITKKHSPLDPPRKFSIRLEKMENTRSFELARFFGSRRVVIVKVKDDLKGDDTRRCLENKFVICGRVFVAIQAKENSVYLVETNEDISRKPHREQGDGSRMTLQQIVDWYNPLKYNHKQVGLEEKSTPVAYTVFVLQAISKWSTRWQLALSTSLPAMEFEGENIFFIGDESMSLFNNNRYLEY